MSEQRPDPDILLAVIQKDDARQERGHLKIFLGMAAGVGKTYAMLEAAHQRKSDGVDVVIGYVETHKRAETEGLARGLECIPRQKLDYRGTTLDEMDTDAILARQPGLVLVDELAHTNVAGTRHIKRYQDVIELLEAGIDVYTTVNVQHFESRADAVRQITGITVHETVPDSILDLANEIELIDLPPDELRKRLQEGKVYTEERAEKASNNFFRVGNLTALREMALRLAAEHVDHQLQDYMQVKRIAGPWKSGERLMVAIGPNPFSERLIRWTRRVAYSLEAPWLAVYVKPSGTLTTEANKVLARTLMLARTLGAEVLTTAGNDVTEALLRLARQRNVTQIVIGKPKQTRIQALLSGGSVTDKLIRNSGDIDVYVVTGDRTETESPPTIAVSGTARHSSVWHYFLALVIVAMIAVIDLLLYQWLGYQVVGYTELLAVMLTAAYIGRGPALLAAAVSAVSWDFLFISPRLTFEIMQMQDVILILLYFVVALFTGNLTARIRTQEKQAVYNAERTMALYALAHEVSTAINMDDVLRTAITQIGRAFDAQVAILRPAAGKLEHNPHPSSTLQVDEKDFGVASWVFDNGKPAGRFTDTLPSATAFYLPLLTPSRTVGVIGILRRQNERLPFDQEVLLETFVSQVALVIERELLDEASEQSAMLRESERLYSTLLNSISHELRTPIATISGAASNALDPNTRTNEAAREQLLYDIQDAADRLNQLVENLLDMSRLESGRLRMKVDWCDVGEVIGAAVQRVEKCMARHPLAIELAPDVPLVKMDFVLIEQVLVNLLDNICHYTPSGAAARITAQFIDGKLQLAVADSGPGLPPGDQEHVFEKFYRAPGVATGGTGLGLSICRGLVEAHRGTLTADNVPGGGARFTIQLPADDLPPPTREANV